MDTKDFIAPVVTFVIGIPTLLLSWKNYKSQRESKTPELARLESWSKLMQEAEVDIGKIDNDEYISSLSKAQKNLVDNYNVFIHRASLEPVLRKIGISDGKVFNKLMSMSRSQKHIQAPGFSNYVSSYDMWLCIASITIVPVFIFVILFLINLVFTQKFIDIPVIIILVFFLYGPGFRVIYLQNKIRMALVINNTYYYLRKFYGVEDNVTDSNYSYRVRMQIKDRAFIIFGYGELSTEVKNNIYMAGINEIDGYCPVQEKEMKPKEYVPSVKTPKLINFLIKVSYEIARKRGIYPEQGSENVEN